MSRLDTGRGSYFSQLYNDGQRASSLVFTHLDRTPHIPAIDAGLFRRSQITELCAAIPLFMLSHMVAAIALINIFYTGQQSSQPAFFLALASMPFVLVCILFFKHDRTKTRADTAEIRWAELVAILFGVYWAFFQAINFSSADPQLRVLIVGVVLAMSAVGTFAFSSVPSAAILYAGIVTFSLAAVSMAQDSYTEITFTFFTVIFGFVLASIVLTSHRSQLQKAIDAQELKQQNEIIGLLLNDFEQGTSDWLWECDADGLLTYASPKLVEIAGISSGELGGLTLLQATNASRMQSGWRQIHDSMSSRQPLVACPLEIMSVGKITHWLISARPLFDDKNAFKGYRGVGRDVSEEWEIDRKLIEAKETAEAASAAKSTFLAVMSHELRTPLNSIVGFSEILASRGEESLLPDVRHDYAATILDSSRHLQTLINDILDATRIENNSIVLVEQEIDAAELLEIATKMCRDQAEKADVTLVAKLNEGIEINADITRTKQIVLNLLVNAIKFSSAGGVVNIEFLRTRNNGLAISIRDAGVGIKPQDLKRIFEPFVQVEESMARRFSGIGLGLSIARKIARMHGGDVTIESRFGEGATACLELPASRVKWPSNSNESSAGVAA